MTEQLKPTDEEPEGPPLDPAHQRWAAAKEYIAASDAVRIAWQWMTAEYGPDAAEHEPSERYRVGATFRRLLTAQERCRELGVWAERPWEPPRLFWEPVWHRNDELRRWELVHEETGRVFGHIAYGSLTCAGMRRKQLQEVIRRRFGTRLPAEAYAQNGAALEMRRPA
jgi:hypothetical protein